jgi:hypothetical protein
MVCTYLVKTKKTDHEWMMLTTPNNGDYIRQCKTITSRLHIPVETFDYHRVMPTCVSAVPLLNVVAQSSAWRDENPEIDIQLDSSSSTHVRQFLLEGFA